AKVSSFVSIGQTILGILFSRKKLSVGTVSRGGTAARGVTRAARESGDVDRAEARLAEVDAELADLQAELETRIETLRALDNSATEPLETVSVSPMKKNIATLAWGLAWQPFYHPAENAPLEPAWEP